jgi:hypothetical protein
MSDRPPVPNFMERLAERHAQHTVEARVQQAAHQEQPMMALVMLPPPDCLPAMIPTHVSWGVTVLNGKRVCVMQIANAAGVQQHFFEPGVTKVISEKAGHAARVADSGIVTPSKG